MTDHYASLILYHPGDPDISEAILRCRDLVALLCQGLYPGADPAGYAPDPKIAFVEPPATLLWWLCSLQMTLDSLYCHASAAPPTLWRPLFRRISRSIRSKPCRCGRAWWRPMHAILPSGITSVLSLHRLSP